MRAVRWVPVGVISIVVVILLIFAGFRLVTYIDGGSVNGYSLRITMTDASEVLPGMPLWIRDLPVGKVTSVNAKGDTAIVTVHLQAKHAPLHAGTVASVEWQSLLDQHYVQLMPGPTSNPVLPSGSMIDSDQQVTVQDLLDSLNGPTRQALSGTITKLEASLQGRGQDLNATIKAAAPTVNAVSQVLSAVGEDGPALDQFATKLHQVTSVLAGRQEELASTVQNLGELTSRASTQQSQLSSALNQLPATLTVAKGTLDAVPGAVTTVDPLLDSLRPAAAELPQTAANLSPVLSELVPTLPVLKSTLQAANFLLTKTPTLLSDANQALPQVTTAVNELQPDLAFLRPYTPEIVGALSTFGNGFAGYDASGHYATADVTVGAQNIGVFPNICGNNTSDETTSQGTQICVNNALYNGENRSAPLPGSNVNQPWTDAFGSGPS